MTPPAPHSGSVYIGGVYLGRNNTNIGTVSTPYATAAIVGGCTKQSKAEICSDSANSHVYADGPPAAIPSTDSLPDINAAETYSKADWSTAGLNVSQGGGCSTGSFAFDSDTTQNGTTPTTTLLPTGGDFDCTVRDQAGNVIGHLAWNRNRAP